MHTFIKFLTAVLLLIHPMIKIKNAAKRRSLFFSQQVQRYIAFLLIGTYLFSNLGLAEPHEAHSFPRQGRSLQNPNDILADLSLPQDLGVVSESFVPKTVNKTTPFVIYLENAHANFESENHIREIIHHLQQQLRLDLVLLEAGEGELDSLFFKSFPDREIKERLLKDYLQKGELSGGEAASISGQDDPTAYYGIEQQTLYNENKKAFLSALQRQPEISKELERIAAKLKTHSKIFHPETRLLFKRETAFYAESVHLIHYAGTLRRLFYHRHRAQRFSRTAFASQFPQLNQLLKQRLSAIQGTQLFFELEALEDELRESLPRTKKEASLLQDFYYLRLLRRLAKLELTRKEWAALRASLAIRREKIKGKTDNLWTMDRGLWTSHLAFYELAVQRDQTLFENANRIIRQKKAKIAVVVTGGFHVQGITQQLRKSNIPFALISPKINQIGDSGHYLRVMTGKASYMNYFRGSLWDAFAQDYTHKLGNLLRRDRSLQGAVPYSVILKRWRDEIIRNAIRDERTTQVGSYTKYVDLLINPELRYKSRPFFDQAYPLIEKRLKIFGAGLKKMWKTGDISPRSLQQVMTRMNTVSQSHLGQDIALISGSRPLVFQAPSRSLRSEIRGESKDGEENNWSQKKAGDDVREKRTQAWRIFKTYHAGKHSKDFFDRIIRSFTLEHLEAETVTADRLSDQILRAYRLFQNHMTEPFHPIQVETFNPVYSSQLGQTRQAGHTEIQIVAHDRVGLDSDITTVLRDAKINIATSFHSKIKLSKTRPEITVSIYEIKHHGRALSEFEMKEIFERLKTIPAKTDSNGHGEIVLKGIAHSQEVVRGEIAVLRELPGGIEDVAYDIFGELRGDISDLGNASEIDGIIRRDRAEFNAAIDWIIGEETIFSKAYPEEPVGLTDQVIAFLKDLKAQTLRRTEAPLNYDHPHRPSALNILLDIVKEKIEQARKLNTAVDGLSIQVVEAIQQRIVNQLHRNYRVYNEDDPESVQKGKVDGEVERFEETLKQALDTKTMDPKTLERLKGIQYFIEGESGIKSAVIRKIQTGGVVAPFAIAEVVIPMITKLNDTTWEKQQLNAKDIQKIFSRVIRFLKAGEEAVHGKPLVGVQTGNNLVLFARHVDPFEVLRVVQEFPAIRAIVSDEGSYSAHWALVAENKGILVSLIDPQSKAVMNIIDPSLVGAMVIVDGRGKIILNPSDATRGKYAKQLEEQTAFHQIALQHAKEEAKTEDGQIIHILANADNAEEIHDAMDNGAEGIGLVRTEYLFREDNELLKAYLKNSTSENRTALVNYFKEIFSDMALHTRTGDLTIRMFDLERDKKSYLDQPDYNPEGAYGLEYYWTPTGKDLLEIEIEAALKANLASTRGQVRVLFPMNQAPEDLARKLKNRTNLINLRPQEQLLLNEIAQLNVRFLNEVLDKVIENVKENLEEGGKREAIAERVEKIQRGFMVETREGIAILPSLLERADFISIGTNDLTIGLFRDLRRIDFPGALSFFKGNFPGLYLPFYIVIYHWLRPVWSALIKVIPIFREIEKNLFYFLPVLEGISRDKVEDAHYLNELQPRVLEAVRRVALQVAKKNLSFERTGLAKRIPLCICGSLAGSNEFALYITHAPPEGVSVELSTSGASIPPLKQFIRGIHHSNTAFFKRKAHPPFDLHAQASKQAALITEKQKKKQLEEYEKQERLRHIQEVNIPPSLEDKSLTPPPVIQVSVRDNVAEVVEEKTVSFVPARAGPQTKSYIVANSLGLHMLPLSMMSKVATAHLQLEAFILINGNRFNMKELFSLLGAASEKGTQLIIELAGPDFDVKEAFKKLENLEEDGEKVFLPAAAQAASSPRSELRLASTKPSTAQDVRPFASRSVPRGTVERTDPEADPEQPRRAELRANGKKPTKSGRIEDIKVEEEIIVDWKDLEDAMQKMPKATKRMPKQEKEIRQQYEKVLFQGLHAHNLTFPQRTTVRNFLVKQNLGLVGEWVNKLGFKGEDVLQNGTIGLMVAISDYDPTIGHFSTYATWWIKNYIYQTSLSDKLAKEPRDYRDIRKRYHFFEQKLSQDLGREPSIEEIAKVIGVSEERLVLAVSWGMRTVYSLDSSYENNDESASWSEVFGLTPKSSEEDQEHILKLLSVLDRRSQIIIKMRFGIGTYQHTLQEVAEIFKVQRERIRQIQNAAIARMKNAEEVLNTDDFSKFVRVMPSEDPRDIYLTKTLKILPSDSRFEKLLKKGRLRLEGMTKKNGHYIFEIQKDEKLEKISFPQLKRYPQVLALGHDLIEHRIQALLEGKDVTDNGQTLHVAFSLKDIRKHPKLLLRLPEELLRPLALKLARSETRSSAKWLPNANALGLRKQFGIGHSELLPIAEMIREKSAGNFDQIVRVSELLRTEQKRGGSVKKLIRDLRVLLKVGYASQFSLFNSLKAIEQKVLIEVHIPEFIEQASGDIQLPLMDSFLRLIQDMVQLNPRFSFRIVLPSKEMKDRLRRIRETPSQNIEMLSRKARAFAQKRIREPADLIISGDFPDILLKQFKEKGSFGFDAKTFADQSSIDWTGSGKVTLEQITLAALTTLTSERLKGIVPDSQRPNVFRAAEKSVLQGLEAFAHHLAVEVTQDTLTRHSA